MKGKKLGGDDDDDDSGGLDRFQTTLESFSLSLSLLFSFFL